MVGFCSNYKHFTEGKHYEVSFEEGCHNWLMFKNPCGYGQVRYKLKSYLAHRLAWILKNGNIPKGMCVLHHCDNPACINTNHLFVGTLQDNSNDMMKKGRGHKAKRENSGKCKLLDQEVIEIRDLYKHRIYTQLKIAKMHKVSHYYINDIIRNKRRKI